MSLRGFLAAILIFGLFYYVSTIAESFAFGIPPFVVYPFAGYTLHLQVIGGILAAIAFLTIGRRRAAE